MEIKQLKKQYIYIILEHTINIFEKFKFGKQDNSAIIRIFHAIDFIKENSNLKNSITLQIQRFFTSSTTKIIIKNTWPQF